jgi:uncharacterized protein YndB with AHSA1/START domain
MEPPLELAFTVACPPEHAFSVWTERTSLWWPKSHSVSADPGLTVTFEPRAGGRIFERDRDGNEHPWGEVLAWEPPHRVRYLWHLFFPRSEATEVDVTFTATPAGTAVRLVQSGFDALGEAGAVRRERTVQGWAAVTARYRARFTSTDHREDRP